MKKIVFIAVIIILAEVLSCAVLAYDSYDGYEYKEEYELGTCLLGSIAGGLVIALIVTGVMWSKLKSVRFNRNADRYIKSGSMKLLRSGDIYLYSNVVRTPKPKNNSSKR